MDIEKIRRYAMNRHLEDNAKVICNTIAQIEAVARNGSFFLDVSPSLDFDNEKYFEHLGFKVEYILHADTTRITW